ncbi:hypothetical protein ACF0H5_016562 [Mactra antiquata]
MGSYVYVCQLVGLVYLVIGLELSAAFICKDLNCEKDECSEDFSCTFGCVSGIYQDYNGNCTRACPLYMYGEECSATCNGCKYGMCEQLTGNCENGCKEGYGGDEMCSVKLSNKKKKTSTPTIDFDAEERNVYIWIASCLISAVIVAVIVIIIYISLQRKQGRKFYDPQIEQTKYQRVERNKTDHDNVEMREV